MFEKIFNLKKDKRKKYTLKFKKSHQPIDWGEFCSVSDIYLIKILLKLQERYDFEIISKYFKSFDDCYITIKCNKEDKDKIFYEYCLLLGNQIKEISF